MPGLTPRQRDTLDLLQAHPEGLMRAKVIEHIGLSADYAGEVLQALHQLGLARVVREGNGTRWVATGGAA